MRVSPVGSFTTAAQRPEKRKTLTIGSERPQRGFPGSSMLSIPPGCSPGVGRHSSISAIHDPDYQLRVRARDDLVR